MENITKIGQEFLNLPYNILFSLSIGYMGYWLACHGYEDESDKSKIYKILIFSLPSLLISSIKSVWLFIAIALIVTVVIAIFWRKWGTKILTFFLLKLKISNANNYDTLQDFYKLIEQRGARIAEIKVYLNNGIELLTSPYANNHSKKGIEDFIIDKKGNTLIYVDVIYYKGKRIGTKHYISLHDYSNRQDIYGITYIPKESIKYIDFIYEPPRSKKDTNNKDKEIKT